MNIYSLHSNPSELLYNQEANEKVPYLVWEKYRHLKPSELRKFEHVFAKDAKTAYWYARLKLWKSFPAGEAVIATDAKYSYLYGTLVLRDRFLLGEPAIIEDGKYVYQYAHHLNISDDEFLKDNNVS